MVVWIAGSFDSENFCVSFRWIYLHGGLPLVEDANESPQYSGPQFANGNHQQRYLPGLREAGIAARIQCRNICRCVD